MKKLLVLALATLLVTGLITGGTFAYFSDTEASDGNSLTSGTLVLNLNGAHTGATMFTATNVKPGATGSGNATLANAGTIAGTLDVAFSAITDTGAIVGSSHFADGTGNLGGAAQLAAYFDLDNSSTWTTGDIGLKSDGTTYLFAGNPALLYGTVLSYGSKTYTAATTLAGAASAKFIVAWNVPTATGNNIQGDGVSFGLTFTLNQQ